MTNAAAEALARTASWPVPHVAAAAVLPDGSVLSEGDTNRRFALASISKMLVGYTLVIAAEEGSLSLDAPAGQPGCTIRHLLAHAGGYAFDGPTPIARPGGRRIYSNTGIELAADALSSATGIEFAQYLQEAVLDPLGMNSTTLVGSPAHGMSSTVDDLLRFVHELRSSRLLSAEGARSYRSVQFTGLAGIVPGFGRFDDCPWGLATEIRGGKQPHWTGSRNSPATFGHFGGAGTMLWLDPAINVACIALADLDFDRWADVARREWPALSDSIIAAALS